MRVAMETSNIRNMQLNVFHINHIIVINDLLNTCGAIGNTSIFLHIKETSVLEQQRRPRASLLIKRPPMIASVTVVCPIGLEPNPYQSFASLDRSAKVSSPTRLRPVYKSVDARLMHYPKTCLHQAGGRPREALLCKRGCWAFKVSSGAFLVCSQ